MSRRMISAPAGESYIRWCTSFMERKPSSAIPSTSGVFGVSGLDHVLHVPHEHRMVLAGEGRVHVRPVVGELLPAEAGRPAHERDPRDVSPPRSHCRRSSTRYGSASSEGSAFSRIIAMAATCSGRPVTPRRPAGTAHRRRPGIAPRSAAMTFTLRSIVELSHGSRPFRDRRAVPRAGRRAAWPRDEALRWPQRAPGRAVRARGLQVDLLHPPGRLRRLRVGRHRQPALRRHRRPVQEVGGDNADAFYRFRPDRSPPDLPGPRKEGRRRLPLPTVYGGPTTATTRSGSSAPSTTGPSTSTPTAPSSSYLARAADGSWLQLEPDAVVGIPATTSPTPSRPAPRVGHRVHRRPAGPDRGARRRPRPPHRAAVRACGTRRRSCPSRIGEPNTVDAPYWVPPTFGWAAGDAPTAWGASTSPRARPSCSGSLTRVRVLEPLPREPAAAHLQLRLRPGDDQRDAGRTRPMGRGSS